MRNNYIYVACLLATAPLAMAASTPALAPLAAPTAPMTMEQLDQGIANMRQVPWAMPGALGNPPPDASGRRVEDDLAEYFLTAPVAAKITALRDEFAASTAPGATIPAEKFLPLDLLMRSEACRLQVIATYWGGSRAYEYHRNLIQRLIERLPEASRDAASGELHAIDTRGPVVRSDLLSGMQVCTSFAQEQPPAGLATLPRIFTAPGLLLEDYGTLRLKLVRQLEAANPGANATRQPTRRSTSCPPPATTTSGRHGATVRLQPDVSRYFPPDAIAFKVTGIAKVRLSYDNTGCVVEVLILESTGAEILDAAAQLVAFDVALNPGEVDGKPAAGGAILPVNFDILDYPQTQPPPPNQTSP